MTRRGPDAAVLIGRALVRDALAVGLEVTVEDTASVPWESATYSGARHRLTLALSPGGVADRWCAGLPEAELPLHGHIVADLTAQTDGGHILVEALTIADA